MSDSSSSHRSRSTLSDVAQAAGVSPSTVSAVMAGKTDVRRISNDTRERVKMAAAQLGYTPNLLHRSMRRGRTHVISFYNAFRNREWSDLYLDRMTAAVEYAGGLHDYDVLSHCRFSRSAEETYQLLNGGMSDGLLFFSPPPSDPLLPFLRSSSLPTVLIDPREAEPKLSYVRDDRPSGMQMIAEALALYGHKRIAAVVEEIDGVLDVTGRLSSLQEELALRGVELSRNDVVLWRGSASDALADVLALPNRPTAVFVWHDRAAYRFVEACEAIGIRVPQYLSVVGYDGLVWPSTSPHVMTSVHVPLDSMAKAAVSLLDRLVLGESAQLTEIVPVQFSPGTTLGPPALMHRSKEG